MPNELNNKWILVGYKVGIRRANAQAIENILEDVDKNTIDSQRLEVVKNYIADHENKFTKDEEDLIKVGLYYKNNSLELPLRFSNPLILLGYYDISLNINNESKHTR